MYKDMKISDMAKLPGISDLRMTAKVKMIKALKAEEEGNHEEAKKLLNEAIVEQEKPEEEKK